MSVARTSILSLMTATAVAACPSEGVQNARQLVAAGDLAEACVAFEAEIARQPDNDHLQKEFGAVRQQFLKAVGNPDSPATADQLALATRYLTQTKAPSWKLREVQLKSLRLAEHDKDWDKMADLALAMGDVAKAARVLTDHPEVDGAATRLENLARENPKDQGVCGAYAGFLGEQRDYDAAIQQYERCQLLEGGTIEHSIYFGAQIATLRKYQQQQKRHQKRRKGKTKRQSGK